MRHWMLIAASSLLASGPAGPALAQVASAQAAAYAALRPVPITMPPRPETRFSPEQVPDPAQVQAVMEYVALAHIADVQSRPVTLVGGSVDQITANWVSAAFYSGLTKVARGSDRPEFLRFVGAVADHYNYAMRGTRSPKGLLNADDQAIGDLYQELYSLRREPGYILPTQQRLDFSLPHLSAEPAPSHLVWWWCDALFMAPPVMSRMSAITGDRRYLDAMDVQWWRTTDLLWDDAESLYFRDARFLDRRSATGAKIFWSRGNGWVMGGLARVLDYMPADYPSRERYLDLFRRMAERIVGLQQEDGLWRASLLETSAFPEPETSGSSLFTYALAWGINHGILDRETYLPAALRGWAGLTRHVLPGGMLGAVQKTGDQPVPTAPDDIGIYGTGVFLMAGSEVMKLGEPASALPVPPPVSLVQQEQPVQRTQAATAPAVPSGTGPVSESERRAQEMQATRDLAYDPRVHGEDVAPWTHGPMLDEWVITPREPR